MAATPATMSCSIPSGDIFERGGEKNWKKILDLVRTDCRDVETMMEKVYLPEYEGGLFNGGAAQMEQPQHLHHPQVAQRNPF